MATVTFTLKQSAADRARMLGKLDQAYEAGKEKDWNAQALDVLPNGAKPGTAAIAELVQQSGRFYILGKCIAAGINAVIEKDRVVLANPQQASKELADQFAEIKTRARSNHNINIERALVRQGFTTWSKQNSGGRRKGAADATTEKAKESLTILPPSFVAKVKELQERVVAFQSTAKLTKVDKESIGKIAECVTAIVAALDAPPTTESKPESK